MIELSYLVHFIRFRCYNSVMSMEEQIKFRIVGAVALVILIVVLSTVFFNKNTTTDQVYIESPQFYAAEVKKLDYKIPTPPQKPVIKEVVKSKVSTKTAVSPKEMAWVVQLASFAKIENAHALEKRLQKLGFTAHSRKIKMPKGTLYKVLVGPETKRKMADELVIKLQKVTNIKGLVVQYMPKVR